MFSGIDTFLYVFALEFLDRFLGLSMMAYWYSLHLLTRIGA